MYGGLSKQRHVTNHELKYFQIRVFRQGRFKAVEFYAATWDQTAGSLEIGGCTSDFVTEFSM